MWRCLAAFVFLVAFLPSPAVSGDPGSGLYAADCTKPTDNVTVDIPRNGTARIIWKGRTYPDQLTSYSFFGDSTPVDFHVAILFDSNLPLPDSKSGQLARLEIWKGEAVFYALLNGEKDKQLHFCGELAEMEAERPSFDCDKAAGEVEKLICSDRELARRDWALVAVFKKALGKIKEDDTQTATLKAEQRGWIKGRNECWKATEIRDCVANRYSDRHATLLAHYGMIEASETQVWACDGDAKALYVTLFMTEPPTVNLVMDERTATAIQRIAASGTRYEAPFGAFFWAKGRDAMLEWPQGSKVKCSYNGSLGE